MMRINNKVLFNTCIHVRKIFHSPSPFFIEPHPYILSHSLHKELRSSEPWVEALSLVASFPGPFSQLYKTGG